MQDPCVYVAYGACIGFWPGDGRTILSERGRKDWQVQVASVFEEALACSRKRNRAPRRVRYLVHVTWTFIR